MKSSMKSVASAGKAKRAKQVRFSEMSELVITERKKDHEMKAAWYSRKDIARFKSKVTQYSKALVEALPAVSKTCIEQSIEIVADNQLGSRFCGLAYVWGIEYTLYRYLGDYFEFKNYDELTCLLSTSALEENKPDECWVTSFSTKKLLLDR